MDIASLRQLRRQPGYPSLVGAATVTRLADEMFSVGTVLLVLERTGSAALAGATIACVTLPSLLSGPVLGAWLDLTGRRRTIMVIDQILMATSLILLVTLTGSIPNWAVPLLGLIAGVTYPLSFGGFTSLIPLVVPKPLLAQANALEASSFNTALIAGPALAGTISAVADPAVSLTVEAVLTLGAIGLIVRIPSIEQRARRSGRSLRHVVRGGLLHLAATPQLRGVTATGMLGLAGIGLLTVAFPFMAVDVLDEPRSFAGYLWAAFAVGSTLGALTLVRLQSRWASERIVFGGAVLFGLLMFSWPLATTLPVALALVVIAGIADGPALTATFATRQRHTPRNLHGQIFVTAASLKVGSFSIGAALAGPTVLAFGSGGAIVVAACIEVAAGLSGLLLSRASTPRWLERAHQQAVAEATLEELDEDHGVDPERERKGDRPAVEVALDHRATAEAAGTGTADAEGTGESRVLARMEQDQEDQHDRDDHLDYREQRVHERGL